MWIGKAANACADACLKIDFFQAGIVAFISQMKQSIKHTLMYLNTLPT
ncbi:hypothetical protein HMPREF9370_0144 [Neisseria wadsworthii 9715]|uniref:Uncharacterized protein n=1 Tax=Neisseria wadsworthii 9715 TaxID=1030841 RepID=G4CM35_9NEIS|nr:hypothetical protein HMPREF9370_0144 [Neisseria wadsworthii 9715]